MTEHRDLPGRISVDISGSARPEEYIEKKLGQVYGTGVFVSDYYATDSGNVSVEIGNSFPKDVSDCRPGERNVVKFIAVDGVAEFTGVREGSSVQIEIEPRPEVNEKFKNSKEELRDRLDQAMAKASYHKIARTSAVDNQLNPIKQILRWTRLHQPIEFSELKKAQGKEGDKTLQYVRILEEFGFIEMEDRVIRPQKPLNKYDLEEISGEEFNQRILGEVIEKGFKRLSRDLGLTILRHLPKIANGYYQDAIERRDPNLHLDKSSIRENIVEWYGYSADLHRWVLEDKLDKLVDLNILTTDDEYYTAHQDTYEDLEEITVV